jgi:proprotein convertase subtilisin/kexin type 5
MSQCAACQSNCLNCSTATDCFNCSALYLFNVTSSTCEADCSSVANCSLCHVPASTLVCDTCMSGYTINTGTNICEIICTGATYQAANKTSCLSCLVNCLGCNDGVTCSSCSPGYVLNSTNLCVIPYNCSGISNCANCSQLLGCVTCGTGYSLANATNCQTVCGDGIVAGT